ncbi:MAG: ABC transporter ATP-binding protein [Opitutae bacterium]|nr:ABC transporter ATP-binding protein [Opitutae bacterium]
MNAIVCENLTRRFGRTPALQELTLTVPEGSIYALLGPNGAGKTTTLKLLLNLLRPSRGTARVLGLASTALRPADFRRIGYVSEDQLLPEWMNVAQLLAYCRPFYPQWDDALAARLRKQFDLPSDRALKHLSRGMRMKAALLSTLAYRPELLVLDEPFGGLDPLTRDDFVHGLLELAGDDRPRTVLLSTHDLDDIERLADHVAFLAESKLLLAEPADALRGRFRQIELTGTAPAACAAANRPAAWLGWREPSPTVVQFVDSSYVGGRTEAALSVRFPGARLEVRPMTLRQIFLALAREQRAAAQEAA